MVLIILAILAAIALTISGIFEEIVITIAAFIVYIILTPFKWAADKINTKRKGEPSNGSNERMG